MSRCTLRESSVMIMKLVVVGYIGGVRHAAGMRATACFFQWASVYLTGEFGLAVYEAP